MNNIIQNIIHKFFNNSQPSTDDILFKKWLLSPKNREEKDQAISEIWDSCQNETPSKQLFAGKKGQLPQHYL